MVKFRVTLLQSILVIVDLVKLRGFFFFIISTCVFKARVSSIKKKYIKKKTKQYKIIKIQFVSSFVITV